MVWIQWSLVALFISISNVTAVETQNDQPPTPEMNCEVRVVGELYKGGEEVNVHYFNTQDKRGCERIAKNFQYNFTPDRVKKVKVTATWSKSK